MKQTNSQLSIRVVAAAIAGMAACQAAPVVSRLTPPSALFSFGDGGPPVIARFIGSNGGQKFDLQATVTTDAGQTITAAQFSVDGVPLAATPSLLPSGFVSSIAVTNGGSGYATAPTITVGGGGGTTAKAFLTADVVTSITVTAPGAGLTSVPSVTFSGGGGTGAAATASVNFNKTIATVRAYSNSSPGVHLLGITATQSDSAVAAATGNFEIVATPQIGRKAKNVIIMIGDGMGASHRTAARIMAQGVQQGKANGLLAMDKFPFTGMVMTSSLNSIVTDSAPGASCYSTGNKGNNNQVNVFPDDTAAIFDNPRVETIGEFLARTLGKSLGIVTTADVFDATPAAFGPHTQARSAGTGICDQYLDEMVPKANLKVLMGGGRKWFLPSTTSGSVRSGSNDSVLPAELAAAWGVIPGALDPTRDLLSDFQTAGGFSYAPTKTALDTIFSGGVPNKLLGLFTLSNMNVAKDKIDGRRGSPSVVTDYGFPDQPMLDEMTDKALQVLNKNPNGFVLMVEGASIDKQAHNMDSERWIEDTIEFDYAIEKTRQFQEANPDTLVVITADHECAGVAIIGASTLTQAQLQARAATGGGVAQLRDPIIGTGTAAAPQFPAVVGTYESAGFPQYFIQPDGYPLTTDVDYRMLIGYASNSDRYEDWLTNSQPAHDSQQPFDTVAPLKDYPRIYTNDNSSAINLARPVRDIGGNFFITGQVADTVAAHTAGDIPVSALGRGAAAFTGYMDNTDVFFRAMQAAVGGAK